ncbi:MAG: DUF502 domain-containing protein [Longimicrobiales bacterium]
MTTSTPRIPTFRRYFLQGLAVIGPLGVTAYVLAWLFRVVDGLLGRYLTSIPGWSAPGVGVLLLVALVIVVGWVVERTLGRRLLTIGERILGRVPVVRQLYRGSSRIVRTVLGDERMAFREVVLFEHPSPGLWALGFVTNDAPPVAEEVLTDPGVTLFLPTAPNPMSGFVVLVDQSKVRKTDLSVEEAFTYVLSAGAVALSDVPEDQDTA